jgi:hypothetical protein
VVVHQDPSVKQEPLALLVPLDQRESLAQQEPLALLASQVPQVWQVLQPTQAQRVKQAKLVPLASQVQQVWQVLQPTQAQQVLLVHMADLQEPAVVLVQQV